LTAIERPVHAVVLSRIAFVPATPIKTRLFATDTVAETFDVIVFAAKQKTLPYGKVFLGEGSTPAAHFSCRQESSAHDERFDGDSIPFQFSFSMASELKSSSSIAVVSLPVARIPVFVARDRGNRHGVTVL